MRISGTAARSQLIERLRLTNNTLSSGLETFHNLTLDDVQTKTTLLNPIDELAKFSGLTVSAEKTSRTQQLLAGLDGQLRSLQQVVEAGQSSSEVQRANYQVLVDQTISGIHQLFGAFQDSGEDTIRLTHSEPNRSQISDFQIEAPSFSGQVTFEGELVSSGQRAELTIAGDDGAIIESAQFSIAGRSGSAEFTVTQGESLTDVRDRINVATQQTSVEAVVEGNNLVLRSLAEGQSEFVSISGATAVTEVAGVNAAQITNFDVQAINNNSSEVINGTVTATASQAGVTLVGDTGGVVKSTASFTVQGADGSATINITAGESLADVRDRVNQETNQTGVSAALSGDNLNFSSTAYGSAGTVSVQSVSIQPTTNTTGVNPAQVADFQIVSIDDTVDQDLSGTVNTTADVAELTYSGVLQLAGSSATFDLTGALGTASISVTIGQSLTSVRDQINTNTGDTGVEATVSGNTLFLRSTGVGSAANVDVNVTSGSFSTSGGNGDGTANGIDATATINGQSLTANGNRFSVTESTGTFEIDFQPGFTGVFDTINVTASPGAFEVTGGNGDGTDSGTDATAKINGQSLTGTANQFNVTTANGSFSVEFAQDFTGNFDDVTVTSTGGGLQVTANAGATLSTGSDSVAIFNGETVTGNGRRFEFESGGAQIAVEFADDFSGAFDPIFIAGNSEFTGPAVTFDFLLSSLDGAKSSVPLPAISPDALGNQTGDINDLRSGGRLADFSDRSRDVVNAARRFVGQVASAIDSLAIFATEQPVAEVDISQLRRTNLNHDSTRVLALLSQTIETFRT